MSTSWSVEPLEYQNLVCLATLSLFYRFRKFSEYIRKKWVDKEAQRFLTRLETVACLKQGIRRDIGPANKVGENLGEKHAICRTQGWLAAGQWRAGQPLRVLAFKSTHFPVETFALPFGINEVILINTARLFTVMVEVIADRLASRLQVDFKDFLKGLSFYYLDLGDWRLPNLARITRKYREMLDHIFVQYDRNYGTPLLLRRCRFCSRSGHTG